jgi:hypothetical protein|tara:strand:+ start:6510 stop:6950 length:441 start_codon:yes stop_codon:yes gene_type:complete
MTSNENLSSQEKSKRNLKKIQDWLDTDPVVPIYHGKVNKTKIFRIHKIPKSTIDTNEGLEELFSPDGPIEKLAKKQKRSINNNSEEIGIDSSNEEAENESTLELTQKIEELQRQVNSINLDLASEEFLIATGRYIPKLYSDKSSSS